MSRSNVHIYGVDGNPDEAFIQCSACSAEWTVNLVEVLDADRSRVIEASIERHLAWCDNR